MKQDTEKEKMMYSSSHKYPCNLLWFLIVVLAMAISSLIEPIVVVVVVVAANDHDIEAPLPLLKLSEFSMETRIKIIRSTSIYADDQYSLSEYYSNVQKRARLSFHVLDEQGNLISPTDKSSYETHKQYFYDGDTNSLLRLQFSRAQETTCDLINANKLTHDLFGEMSSQDEHLRGEDWLQERKGIPKYIIGGARLLMIVNSNWNKLEFQPREGNKIRSHNVDRYKLQVALDSRHPTEMSELIAYYANTNDESTYWTKGADMPLRIWVKLANRAEIMIDYLSIAPINPMSDLVKDYDVYNLFTFPVASGCSSDLKRTNLIGDKNNKFDHFSKAPRVVSFRAEIVRGWIIGDGQIVTRMTKHFIAYDGYAKSLRFDSVRNGDPAQYSISIYDLIRNRKYNIRQPVSLASESNFINNDFEYQINHQQSQCVSSEFSTTSNGEDYNDKIIVNPFEPLLPFNNLAEMGQVNLRGINAKCFERETNQLPSLLFPRVNFVDDKGTPNASSNLTTNNGKETINNSYKIIYYFGLKTPTEPNGFQLGPLMRIDIYDKSNLIYMANIYDFVWQLSDAPNGDRQDNLFALSDICMADKSSPFGNGGNNKDLAIMSMLLELSYGIPQDQLGITAALAKEMIVSPKVRNKALIRGISAASGLAPTQIHEIESKASYLIENEKEQKLIIKVASRLTLNEQHEIYEAVSIGSGALIKTQPITSATTFEDCFWDAVHEQKRQNGILILFTYCYSNCLIDNSIILTSSIRDGMPIRNSRMFKISSEQEYSCKIFKLEVHSTLRKTNGSKLITQLFTSSRSIWEKIYNNLRTKVLRLPLVDISGGGAPSKTLEFQVKQLEINHNKWPSSFSSAVDDENDDNNQQLLENSEEILTNVGLSPTSYSTTKQIKGQTNEKIMDYQYCRANCLADMNCYSYSVCINAQELECLTSGLVFRNPNLLAQIKKKKDELGTLKKRIITVDVVIGEKDKSTSSEPDKLDNIVELRIDRRCRIHSKNVLEMFKLSTKIIASSQLSNRNLKSSVSEENCAEMCLNNNIEVLKRKLELSTQQQQQQQQQNETYQELMNLEKQNMKYWCGTFGYINLATSTIPESIKVNLKPEKLTKNGLCFFYPKEKGKNTAAAATNKDGAQNLVSTTTTPSPSKQKTSNSLMVSLQTYDFIYSMLFEKQYGVKLLEVKKHEMKDSNSNEIVAEDNNNNGYQNNIQLIYGLNDIELCARACFLQTIGLGLTCRSFDYVEDRNGVLERNTNMKQLKPYTYCVFNSITLAEAEKSLNSEQLFTTQVLANLTYLHYEPRGDYSMGEVIGNKFEQEISSSSSSLTPIKLRVYGVLTVIIVSLISGWLLGITLARQINERFFGIYMGGRRESVENPSRSFLNSLITSDDSSSTDTWHRRFDFDFDLPELTIKEPTLEQPERELDTTVENETNKQTID